MAKYTRLFMVILLIGMLMTSINIYAQQQEYKLYAKQRIDITFSLSISGSQSGSMSMSMSLQREYDFAITGNRVIGEIRAECLEASIDYSYGSTRTSTRIPSNECNKLLAQREREIDSIIEDIYDEAFRESLQQLEELMQYVELPLSLSINIDFNGFQTYNGYRVADLGFSFNMKYEYYGTSFEGSGKGREYVYVGFPITLYGEGKIDISVKSSEGSGSGSLQIKLETLEADLPKETPYGYVKHDKYTILAAGLPSSKIVVSGDKGGKTLTIRNEGNATGYVAIIYLSTSSSPSPSIKLEAYNDNNSLNQQKIDFYVLNPGEEQSIILPFILSDNVNIVTCYTSGFDMSLMLIVIIIIVVIVIAVSIPIYLLLRSRRKPDITPAPTIEQPPLTI
ncbi:hypothetical protein Igag_0783 [Ignisphaera aggregans DSM 17230]|uniref:CARDB domain-containing protein n=1 Tax=Ignisphaera aggregans (strain DSM 17230 / JCM 13409 / AQ1.S1) TaxID=583356 RepID=E0STD2_IGNAA|nr:hypothetical protein Igag_0783 [Ignisphaera aggregans DSM 17230]